MAQSYEKAGVNLEAGYEVVRRIKKHVASTSRLGVMGNIGAFGGMFDLSALNVKEPVLVSGTDGVAPSSSWRSRWTSTTRSASMPWPCA